MPDGFELVIFDCDGVLVDSERLAIRSEARILANLGWRLDESEIIERFVGRSASYMQAEVERHIGRPLDWEAEFEPEYRAIFARELVAVDGVVEALDAISTPTCVASSSSLEKLTFTLGLTGLLDRFVGRLFSVDEVALGKPAPDVFLHAAAKMGAQPRRCAVIEDSVAGVAAGLAAGMAVYGFAGGVTSARVLRRDGVTVFANMSELPALLGARAA
jgi:HAD superfamily hydrolase (TIGR01509 family)